MTGELYFLPFLRRGLVRFASTADPGAGSLAPGSIDLGMRVAGTAVGVDVHLLAPHHVEALVPSEIVRRSPSPGATGVETNFFPLVEFSSADLPWRYLPARPGQDGRLRPWLALVVVDPVGVEYAGGDGFPGRLVVPPGELVQLPPHHELWGWAHVQSGVPPDDVPGAVTATPDLVRSRIVCPRRLAPGRTYRAALVNAFTVGADGHGIEPAWDGASAEPVTLTVYDTWTFETAAEAGDFESLCELLLPAGEVGRLGVRSVDVTDPGIDVAWTVPKPVLIELTGALADPALIDERPPRGNAAFAAAVKPILESTVTRATERAGRNSYDPMVDDPVVGLPFHGSWPANAAGDGATWASEVNSRSDRRAAAGLGALIVRRAQEELVAAAWDQAGSLREAADELNRARLSAEVGRSWLARLAEVGDGDRVCLAAPLLTFLRVDGDPARRRLASSEAPSALVERAWLRRGPRARAAHAAHAFLSATSRAATIAQRAALAYRQVATPPGAVTLDAELAAGEAGGIRVLGRDVALANNTLKLAERVGGAHFTRFVRGERPIPPRRFTDGRTARAGAPSSVDAAEVAAAITSSQPLTAGRAGLVARVPALDAVLAPGTLPAALHLGPTFEDPLFFDLAEIDPDVIVPGLVDFPTNRVRLLGVNGGFVGALIIGANHEMARELLWREYPTDLAATFFARFFAYDDPQAVDIAPLADWDRATGVADNVPVAAATTVLLIRGDLIRRYPDLNIFLTPQTRDGELDFGSAIQPNFASTLDAETLVVGFPRPPAEVLGQTGLPEYFVAFEERVLAPRFGLDVDRHGPLTGWDELTWGDFPEPATHASAATIPRLGTPEFGGIQWGRNAAHLAAAVHQRPYRRLYPASRLVGT